MMNEWAQQMSEISDTKPSAKNPIQKTFQALINFLAEFELL